MLEICPLQSALASLAGMVLVPKFPPIPRLSIIVPVGSDNSTFEETLVSVLENRPADCEVIVPHDGHYDDPFNLSDEVRFVIADGGNLVELVMAAARSAHGQYVHILADGLRATEGWTEAAINRFENDNVACVVPVIRNSDDDRIVAAGWQDTRGMLLHPLAAVKTHSDTATASAGAYLRASFWRRSVLVSLGDAFLYDGRQSDESVSEATYVFHRLLQHAGWESIIAAGCDIRTDFDSVIGEAPSADRGRRLGAAQRFFDTTNASIPIVGLVKAAVGCVVRKGEWGQWFGRATSGRDVASLERRLRPTLVRTIEQRDVVLSTPKQTMPESVPLRRAA